MPPDLTLANPIRCIRSWLMVDRMQFDQLKRREFITLVGGATAAWPLVARAEQPEGVRRLGVLVNLAESDPITRSRTSALEQGLQKLGWVVGRNLRIDYRFAAADVARMPKLANELVALTPHVLLAGNTPTLAALQKATGTIRLYSLRSPIPWAAALCKASRDPAATSPDLCLSSLHWGASG